jgi:hypothetical protein
MDNKPNIPDEVFLGSSKEYSWRTDLKVNGWLMLAVLMSGVSDFFFAHQVKQLAVALRSRSRKLGHRHGRPCIFVDDAVLYFRSFHFQPTLQIKFMKWSKKYLLRMTFGFIAYASGIFALHYFFKDKEHSPCRFLLILLPVLPLLYIAATIIRYISEMDEMWRMIITEALAFSAIATGFTCISYLFLHDIGAPEFRAYWAFDIMWAYYGIGLFFSWRRYK